MKANENHICEHCGTIEAVTTCDHCGKPLCRSCHAFELWGTGAEDLSVRNFCPACKNDPEVNPWGARPSEAVSKDALRAA